MTEKKKSSGMKIKPVPIIIALSFLIVIGVIIAIVLKPRPKVPPINIRIADESVSKSTAETQNVQATAQETTVSIDLESCAIPVGTSLKVTATVRPDDSDKTVNWNSSNQDVFTVDSEGIMTIKGIGTAALTATAGSASDAIVVEGVSNSGVAKSTNNFKVYQPDAGQKDSLAVQNTSRENSSNKGIAQKDESSDNSIENSGNHSADTGNNTGNPSGSNNPKIGAKSTEIAPELESMGYVREFSNVYVYKEDDTYYGEIIIQPNVAIIYIKQRNASFETKINQVISQLLPGAQSEVWNNYLSASSDRTFTVDGRTVRIVTAGNGGHSQIVIYN